MEGLEYFTSQKGGRKLSLDGYTYTMKITLKSGTNVWECDQRRNKKQCKVFLHIDDDEVIIRTHEHTHAPDQPKADSHMVANTMKRRAIDTEETPTQIISAAVSILPDEVHTKMASPCLLRRNIRRARKNARNDPNIPIDRNAFENCQQRIPTL